MSNCTYKFPLLTDILRAIGMTAAAVLIVLATKEAFAHAVLMHSEPAANAIVQGPNVTVNLKFNSRVDGGRSVVLLATPDGKSQPLTLEKQASPDTLRSSALQLHSGSYVIRWQVLAIDGHITRGQIPFKVQ